MMITEYQPKKHCLIWISSRDKIQIIGCWIIRNHEDYSLN
jgi:hypothetical protein